MLLRAAFWIGVVSVLMPHEPNLGYGSPSLGANVADRISNWTEQQTADTAEPRTVERQHRTLAQVKAEIAAARHPF